MFNCDLLFLFLAALASSSLQVSLKYSVQKGNNIMIVLVSNYFVASALCGFFVLSYSCFNPSLFTVLLAVPFGVLYPLGLIVIVKSFGERGVVLTNAIVQLAYVVPIAFSIGIWAEWPTLLQSFGVILAVVSFPLLSIRKSGHKVVRSHDLFIAVAVLIVNGLALTSGKILVEAGYYEESIMFYLIVFLNLTNTSKSAIKHQENTNSS